MNLLWASYSEKNNTAPITELLYGDKPFYKNSTYQKDTKTDFLKKESLTPIYTWNTETKTTRVFKKILSIIIFPIGIYQTLHSFIGKLFLLPSSGPTFHGLEADYANKKRATISLFEDWKYKRIAVKVDGYTIDATIVVKESTATNRRWLLASNGNAEFYENTIQTNFDLKEILSKVNGNAIVFNYPGVGCSSGPPNRNGMTKSYLAMLNFLEDQETGIGAKEIIGFGHSIGAGVQGDALRDHKLKKDVKYVFVKKATFSNLATEVHHLTNFWLFGFLVKIFGWNIDSVESSKKLEVPEIILQRADIMQLTELNDTEKLIDDGIIPPSASLAKALLEDTDCPKKNKVFIGTPERHNEYLKNTSFLIKKINELLDSQSLRT